MHDDRSMMVGKTPRARKNERDRMEVISLYCGCLPCLLVGHLDRHTSIEHVTDAGFRIGKGPEQHEYTIGLCVWHHYGRRPNRSTRQHMSGEFGPPLAWGRKTFEAHFGDEVKVLVPLQDYLLELFAADPWPEYNINGQAVILTRNKWIELNHANDHLLLSPRKLSS